MENKTSNDGEAQFVAELTGCQSALALYVRGLMPGDGAAEEVVQQANAKIWQKRGEFQTGTNFRAWALAIARFEVLNYRKRQARDARLSFSDELEQTIATEIAVMDDDLMERHTALRKCLEDLKPSSRDLLMSRYASQESLADVAARVGRTVGGIKVTLSRLRSALADCIERRLQTEGGPS
jgi:RNA polymerase sigma-70 factor (ECF subfamily)